MSKFVENFLIDDLRRFKNKNVAVEVAKTSSDALAYLKDNKTARFYAIWLDHDLGIVSGQKDTTMPIVDYMCERAYNNDPVNVEVIYIHTSNPVGRRQIAASLNRYGYSTRFVYAPDYFIV